MDTEDDEEVTLIERLVCELGISLPLVQLSAADLADVDDCEYEYEYEYDLGWEREINYSWRLLPPPY